MEAARALRACGAHAGTRPRARRPRWRETSLPLGGHDEELSALLVNLYLDGHSVGQVADGFLCVGMQRIGDLWHAGELVGRTGARRDAHGRSSPCKRSGASLQGAAAATSACAPSVAASRGTSTICRVRSPRSRSRRAGGRRKPGPERGHLRAGRGDTQLPARVRLRLFDRARRARPRRVRVGGVELGARRAEAAVALGGAGFARRGRAQTLPGRAARRKLQSVEEFTITLRRRGGILKVTMGV